MGWDGWIVQPALLPALRGGRRPAITAGGPPLQGETDLTLLVSLRVRGALCGQRQKAHSRVGLWGRGWGHRGASRAGRRACGGSFGLVCWGGGHVALHDAGPGAEATCVELN